LDLEGKQNALITRLAKAHADVVVVLQTGCPVTMPWLGQVAAVMCAWFPASGGADAIAGILFGRVNPSGRLPITFPQTVDHLPRPAHTDPETTTSNPCGEIVQLYMARLGPDGYPKRLAAFFRVALKPGERKKIRLRAEPRIIARFHAGVKRFVIEDADYVVSIGHHSRDEAWQQTVRIGASTESSLV